MRVYFEKLGNGDWICYDEQNTTGDLFVDPSKMDLIYQMIPYHRTGDNYKHLHQSQKVNLPGYGTADVNVVVFIQNDVLNHVSMYNHDDATIAVFTERFVLELPELPKFDNYPYPDQVTEPDDKVILAIRDEFPGSVDRSDTQLRKMLKTTGSSPPQTRLY